MAGPIEARSSQQQGQNPEDPLKRLIKEGRVWWGTDLRCVAETLIRPRQITIVELTIPDGGLPPGAIPSQSVGRFISNSLEFSIRSRYAQLGVQIVADKAGKIPVEFNPQKKTISFNILGLGGRPVDLPEGEGLGCLYSLIGGRYFYGEDVLRRAASVIRTTEGKRAKLGREWFLEVPGLPTGITRSTKYAPVATGMALRLSPKRYRIPVGREPVNLSGIPDYRKYLDEHVFEPIGEKETPVGFWVGETMGIIGFPLTEGIVGVLGNHAFIDGNRVVQTRSHLIKPGQTDWPLRYEFYDPHGNLGQPQTSSKGHGIQYVAMRLMQQP